MQPIPLYICAAGGQVTARPVARHKFRARVLWAGYSPQFIDGVFAGSDQSPVDVALGFGPFVWAWPFLRRLPARFEPLYFTLTPWHRWNPFGTFFLKPARSLMRAGGGWFFLRGEITFAHLVLPWEVNSDGSQVQVLPELPAVGTLVEVDAWSVDIVDIFDDHIEPLAQGHHGSLPSRQCPWLWIEHWEEIECVRPLF
jgi:hypothetical protein